MQPKQLIGGAIAIGVPLAAVWMMMQPPGGSAPTPAAKPAAATANTAKTEAPKPAANGAAPTPAILNAPVPQPKSHAKSEKSPVSAVTKAVGDEYALYFTANGLGEYDDCGCKKREPT